MRIFPKLPISNPLPLIFLCLPLCLFAEAPPAPKSPVSLFDGKSLTGWEGDPTLWRVSEGMITGGSFTETVKHNDFVATQRDYGNFILRLKIRLRGAGGFVNSGVQIRSQRVPNNSEMAGYQCDYGDPTWWGCIYDESRRNKLMAQSDMKLLEPVLRRNDWNDYVVRADGPRIQTWINGVPGVDYVEQDESIPLSGKIGIQVHGGGKALVEVKDVTIEELPPTPAPAVFTPAADPGKPRPLDAGPLTATEQQKTFTLPPGFSMELVAEEAPGVGKFITTAWDAAGNLWTMTAFEYPVDGNENPAAADALYASKGKDKVLVYDLVERGGPGKPPRYAKEPRVFAEGLAIPLGLLPYKDGAIVQHGKEMVFLRDTDHDGKADKREVLLEGLGVDDSHLFLHGLTRGPGGWIYVAQGAFNHSNIKAGDGSVTKWDFCKLGRFTPDGQKFELVAAGLNNIWGFVIDRQGYLWGQEANDMGYPLTPISVGDNFPGIGNQRLKPYAPVRPKAVTTWTVGGTGLSGLALQEDAIWPEPYCTGKRQAFYLANPITNRLQATLGTPTGPGESTFPKIYDFVRTSDQWFRPVHIEFGPDGCLYVVDWYNRIISHNEVPRNFPDRDKLRGRIWRIRHQGQPSQTVPNFPKMADAELAKFKPQNRWEEKTAWAERSDRGQPHPADQAWPLRDLRAELASQTLAEIAKGTPAMDETYATQHRRYMIQAELEKRGPELAKFMAEAPADLSTEFLGLALQSLPGQAGAEQLVRFLAKTKRAPQPEELAKLAEFTNVAEVKSAFEKALSEKAGLEALLSIADRVDLKASRASVTSIVETYLAKDEKLALKIIAAFRLKELSGPLEKLAAQPTVERLKVLRSLGVSSPAVFKAAQENADPAIATEALLGLANSPAEILPVLPKLNAAQARSVMEVMAKSKAGAEALLQGVPHTEDLEGPILETLESVLGANSPAWTAFLAKNAQLFHEVMDFNGDENSIGKMPIELAGPFTVETWIKLDPNIGNTDGILGQNNELDANFYDGKFRIFVQSLHDVVIAKKPVTAGAWTHVAFSRDAENKIRIYQNGELESVSNVSVPNHFKKLQVAKTGAPGGTSAKMAEYRIWNTCRTDSEIRRNFDRSLKAAPGLVQAFGAGNLPQLTDKAKLAKTLDYPNVLTEAQAKALEEKFVKFTALAGQKGDLVKGKAISALCAACHQFGETGGKIGPNLTGVGSMSLEAILRNILTPNAAMEAGYRVYQIRMLDGSVKEGFFASEDAKAITFRLPGLPDERIPKEQIQQARFLTRSLMPEGQLDSLPDENVRDLLSYLQSLK